MFYFDNTLKASQAIRLIPAPGLPFNVVKHDMLEWETWVQKPAVVTKTGGGGGKNKQKRSDSTDSRKRHPELESDLLISQHGAVLVQ